MRTGQQSFRSSNLEALRRVQPALADYLSELEPDPQQTLELLESRSGRPTGRYCGVLLHSRHDPEEEARRLFDRADNNMAYYLLEGFGMGYLAENILDREPNAHIIVVEPDLNLFLQTVAARDLTHLFGSERVSYLFDATQEAIDNLSSSIGIIRFRPLYERHRAIFEQVDRLVSNHLTRLEVNRNTLARFGRVWVRNLSLNLPVFDRARPLAELYGLLSGLPGLLLGGGPSLDAILPRLPELAQRCVITAVDTSLGACLRAGVEPDFVVVVDPQYWNTRHLDRCAPGRAILISESSTHPRAFRILDGPVHFCSSLFPLGEYLEQQVGELGKLGAGGSVSTSAWDFLRLAGCAPIYTAGIDLGFPHRQTHFRGSFFEERIHAVGNRLRPAEHHLFRYLNDAGLFQVPDNSGRPVDTDRRMIIYRWWFERQAERFPQAQTRALSAHAVRLSGIPLASVEEILSGPPVRARVDELLSNLRSVQDQSPPTHGAKLAGAVRTLIDELLEIEQIAQSGAVTVEAARATVREDSLPTGYLDELNRIDTAIFQARNREIVGFLLQKEIQPIVESAHRSTTMEKALEDSAIIYRGLVDSARYHRACLERGLTRLSRS